MISDDEVEKALCWLRDHAEEAAQITAERKYLEEFRKSKKAILFNQAPDGPIAEKESWAYANKEYQDLLLGYQVAVGKDEKMKWLRTAAEAKISAWQTQQATHRAMKI